MRIVVLCGGESNERDVSWSSGLAVARALLERGEEVVLVDPALADPIIAGPMRGTASEAARLPEFAVPAEPPDLTEQPVWRERMFAALTSGPVLAEMRRADVVFLAMHGGWGEDGHLQALLDMAGVRYTGADSTVCAAAWHKEHALALLRQAGVPATPTVRFRPGDGDALVAAKRLLDEGPVVVKPLMGGSSVDVALAHTAEELRRLVETHAEELLIEPYLPGREFTVGVVGDQALPVVEIVLTGPLFDYRSKYQPGAVQEVCPAEAPAELTARMQALAVRAHQALGFGPTSYSRVDFRCDRDGNPVVLELNSLPGLTPTSLLPRAARAAGWPFPELVRRIIDLALARYGA